MSIDSFLEEYNSASGNELTLSELIHFFSSFSLIIKEKIFIEWTKKGQLESPSFIREGNLIFLAGREGMFQNLQDSSEHIRLRNWCVDGKIYSDSQELKV